MHLSNFSLNPLLLSKINTRVGPSPQQWAQFNIRVNAVALGLTKTRFSEALWKNPDILKVAMSRTPMARPADPEEMVGAIIYLASDTSSYVTDQVIAIDGGITI
jgi:NAD(P)-dependent dehydrogenase (short-subunit alcohol dehydrogenase family)